MSQDDIGARGGSATRTLQSIADELDLPIDWVVEEGANLAHWGWDDRFVDDWGGEQPPPGDAHWSGGCYWNIGTEQDWPGVEISAEMADRLVEILRGRDLATPG